MMNDQIKPQPGILDIALYEGGKAHVAGVANVVKLSSNENPFGPSDKAKEAFGRTVHSLHRYPVTDHADLRAAIAEVHGLDAARIICGAGSDEIITFLCQAYAGPRDEVVFTEHGFLMYRISSLAVGATPVEVQERERTADVDAILAACNRRTKLVFLANPNNPTGTMISAAEIARLAESLPPQALLVLDGAYAEYVEGYDGGAALVDARDNVVMTRTFSKVRRAEPDPGAVQPVDDSAGDGGGRRARPGVRGQVPVRKHPDAVVAGQCFGRDRGALGHLDGQLHPGAFREPGRGRGLRCLPAEAGADRAPGGGLQAAALPADHHW